ncbi:IclR family transcriptional regulator [Cognatishimia activa]|uniref:IclR family transcriptional regulator n=1 Tax=Cognatishimia activa TaxID=1715691 RepID=UPI0022313D98|nr:IclR family transcriptional regulator [Cognatishimia activa]UZD91275.1 IclR family transcriptional regulator [Cognatishimia activa]
MTKRTFNSTTLTRSLAILELLARSGKPMTFSEIMLQSDIPKSTGHRLLTILTNEDMVQFDPDTHTYRSGMRLASLSFQTWYNLDIRNAGASELKRLSDLSGENVHTATREGGHIIYADRVESAKAISMRSSIGDRSPMYCSSMGKAIVASMNDAEAEGLINSMEYEKRTDTTIGSAAEFRQEIEIIRDRGYAIDNGENNPDVRCVAAAIRDFRGTLRGALGISAPRFRADDDKIRQWGKEVVISAANVSAALGWTPDNESA